MTRLSLPPTALLAAMLASCTFDRPVDVVVLSPTGAVAHELRVRTVDAGFECPTLDDGTWRTLVQGEADRVYEFGEGLPAMPIGELPRGHYAFVYVGRGASCEALHFGCEAVEIGPAGPRLIEISVEPFRDAEAAELACAAEQCDRGFCR